MSSIHIPIRLEKTTAVNAASFYPDSMMRYQNHKVGSKSSQAILETFGFRSVGSVVADTQVSGAAISQINVINYTGQAIVCLDSFNRVQVIPPSLDNNYGNEHYKDSVFIELVSSRAVQYADLGVEIWRRYAELGTHSGNQVSDYYYTDHRHGEAPKYQGNNIHQFMIEEAINELVEHGGSFYHPETDLVFMTLETASQGDIVVHPRTDSTFLSKKDFDSANDKTITHQIRVNYHRSNASYVNIGGDVMEVPNLKNPNIDEGIYLCRYITRAGAKTKKVHEQHYAFNDPACPLNLFDSEEAARTNGHPDKLLDLEIVKSKREVEIMKVDLLMAQSALAKEKTENERLLEEDRLTKEKHANELKQKEAVRLHQVTMKKQAAEEEKLNQAKDENKTSHRQRMLEIGGKIILAVAGVFTSLLTIYRLSRI